MNEMILGVEGGGSQTRIVAEEAGRVTFRAFNVSIKYHAIGVSAAVERLAAIIEEHYRNPAAIALALSGAATGGEDFARALAERLHLPHERVHVETDSALTLDACATDAAVRIVLISGTGSIAIGRDPNGAVHTAGGWGPVIGDEGSGRSIGRAALAHLTRVVDKREKPSELSDTLRREIGLDGDALHAYLKAPDLDTARFAKVVFETKSKISEDILEDAAHQLAKLVQAVILRVSSVHTEHVHELFLSGSVAKSIEIQQRLQSHFPLLTLRPMDEDAPARALLERARGLISQDR
jgi:glucosamine kinase